MILLLGPPFSNLSVPSCVRNHPPNRTMRALLPFPYAPPIFWQSSFPHLHLGCLSRIDMAQTKTSPPPSPPFLEPSIHGVSCLDNQFVDPHRRPPRSPFTDHCLPDSLVLNFIPEPPPLASHPMSTALSAYCRFLFNASPSHARSPPQSQIPCLKGILRFFPGLSNNSLRVKEGSFTFSPKQFAGEFPPLQNDSLPPAPRLPTEIWPREARFDFYSFYSPPSIIFSTPLN